MKYLLLLLVCMVGCAQPSEQQVVSKSPAKIFMATVLAVESGQPPKAVAVVKLSNGGLYTLVEPFNEVTATKVKLQPGDVIAVEYVDVFVSHFKQGKLAYTTLGDPRYEVKQVSVGEKPSTNKKI